MPLGNLRFPKKQCNKKTYAADGLHSDAYQVEERRKQSKIFAYGSEQYIQDHRYSDSAHKPYLLDSNADAKQRLMGHNILGCGCSISRHDEFAFNEDLSEDAGYYDKQI